MDSIRLGILCERLNNVDWEELGFVCDGRFLFSQRSLENAVLDSSFLEFANNRIINEVEDKNLRGADKHKQTSGQD